MKLNQELLNALYRYGYSLTQNSDAAYDLLYSAIEKILQHQSQIEFESVYIRKTMRNLFIDQCRRNKIVAFEPLDDHEPLVLHASTLEDQVVDDLEVEKLMACLSAQDREILFLWAVLEYSAREIGEELDMPRGTILSKLHRIKKKLHEQQKDAS